MARKYACRSKCLRGSAAKFEAIVIRCQRVERINFDVDKTCRISTGVSQALNKAGAYRVRYDRKHYRNGVRLP